MTFLIFFTTSRKCFPPKIKGKHFPGNQVNFSLTGKCFPLTNFSNGKQTQKSLKSNFLKTSFQKTKKVLMKQHLNG
jgi:hypothetical protein